MRMGVLQIASSSIFNKRWYHQKNKVRKIPSNLSNEILYQMITNIPFENHTAKLAVVVGVVMQLLGR
jgi:hypothetical protein